MAVTASFTAVGAGGTLAVKNGDQFTYAVTNTFVATLALQVSTDAGTSWQLIKNLTITETNTIVLNTKGKKNGLVRFYCTDYTSGTADTTLTDVTSEVLYEVLDKSGNSIFSVTESGITVTGTQSTSGAQTFSGAATFSDELNVLDSNLKIKDNVDPTKIAQFQVSGLTTATTRTYTLPNASATLADLSSSQTFSGKAFNGTLGATTPAAATVTTLAVNTSASFGTVAVTRTSQVYMIPASGGIVGATSGWVVRAAADTAYATVAAGQSASTFVLPILGLKVGWTITAFSLIGNITSAGNTATMDAALKNATAGAAAPSVSTIGSMIQLSVTSNTAMSAANTTKSGLSYAMVATDNVYLVLTVTTAASTTCVLQGALITVSEA